MTFESLVNANKALCTTDIKGKDYIQVNERIKAFRMLFPNGSILTDLIKLEDGMCVFKATIISEDGTVLGTGTAYEKETSSFINKTSYIENCETSAVGRALGMLGIGIDTSLASYEEVSNAIANQSPKGSEPKREEKVAEVSKAIESAKTTAEEGKARAEMLKLINDNNINVKELFEKWHITISPNELNEDQAKQVTERLKKCLGIKEDKTNE